MRHSRSESGFALIEVVVAAAVLAMVALAVLSGVDGATSATGREHARAVAASLAEQDQERLRSMQIDTLSKFSEAPRAVDVDGVTYTVKSTARWVRDDTSAVSSCATGDNKQSDYLYITSTVTSNVVGVRSAPVSVQSIVTPSVAYSAAAGSLAVVVNNRDSVGVPNLAVSIAGPSNATRQTDASGCVLFELIPEGDYTVTLNRSGWVDKDLPGNNPATASAKVNRGTLTKQTMVYDQAAKATLTIKTYQPGSTTATLDSSAGEVSTFQAGYPVRQFPASSGLKHSIDAANLFPFTTAYPFWTGNCASESPATYDATYFSAAGGRAVQTAPGGFYLKDVFQPPVNLRVTRDRSGNLVGSGSAHPIDVKATFQPDSTDPGCSDTVKYDLVTNPATGTPGWLSQSGAASYDPGIPAGKWTICIYDRTSGRKRTASYDATKPITGQPNTVDLAPAGASWSTGTC